MFVVVILYADGGNPRTAVQPLDNTALSVRVLTFRNFGFRGFGAERNAAPG